MSAPASHDHDPLPPVGRVVEEFTAPRWVRPVGIACAWGFGLLLLWLIASSLNEAARDPRHKVTITCNAPRPGEVLLVTWAHDQKGPAACQYASGRSPWQGARP